MGITYCENMLKWAFLAKSVKVIPNNLLQTDVKKQGSTPRTEGKNRAYGDLSKKFFPFFLPNFSFSPS